MKNKQIFIIILLSLITMVCKAQNFDAGVKLGLVGSQVDGDTYAGYNKFGIDIGAYVNYHLSQKHSLQLELEFIQKGSSHSPNYDIGDFNQYLMRVNYVQVPVLWHYQANQSISFETGPAFGVLMSNYEEYIQGPVVDHPFRKFALSYLTGLGYNISPNLKANFRIDYSLIGLRQKSYPDDRYIFFQWGQFSNALVISVQYIIKHANAK